jgi:hypothetical protein
MVCRWSHYAICSETTSRESLASIPVRCASSKRQGSKDRNSLERQIQNMQHILCSSQCLCTKWAAPTMVHKAKGSLNVHSGVWWTDDSSLFGTFLQTIWYTMCTRPCCQPRGIRQDWFWHEMVYSHKFRDVRHMPKCYPCHRIRSVLHWTLAESKTRDNSPVLITFSWRYTERMPGTRFNRIWPCKSHDTGQW